MKELFDPCLNRKSTLAEAAQLRLAALVHSSDDAIISETLTGIIASWNPGAERMFGYTAAEIIGQSITLIFPPESLVEESEILARISRGERIEHFETIRICKDQQRLAVEVTISADLDGNSKIIGVYSVTRDVTARKQAEAALQESNARLRAIINHDPECVKMVAPDGRLLEMNPAGLRMIEADSLEQVLGQSIFPLISEEHRNAFRALHEKVIRGESGKLEFDIIGLKGARRSAEMHATPSRNAAGDITALLSLTRDITARKEAEQKIQKQLHELQRWQEVMLGREDRVMELKREVNALLARQNQPLRYTTPDAP